VERWRAETLFDLSHGSIFNPREVLRRLISRDRLAVDPSPTNRARKKRGKSEGARNSAPFLHQGKQDDDAAKYEADGVQVAK
jgi:hypothetical protein